MSPNDTLTTECWDHQRSPAEGTWPNVLISPAAPPWKDEAVQADNRKQWAVHAMHERATSLRARDNLCSLPNLVKEEGPN